MEIVPGIHKVDGVNGNCYVVDRENLMVIDTGMPGIYREKFLHCNIRGQGPAPPYR